jgi:hypothetical protein
MGEVGGRSWFIPNFVPLHHELITTFNSVANIVTQKLKPLK